MSEHKKGTRRLLLRPDDVRLGRALRYDPSNLMECINARKWNNQTRARPDAPR